MIIKFKGDWIDVVNACRSTVGKTELDKEPSDKFKKEILKSEHSPIRCISIVWKWSNIKSWVATHWSRHKWECFIRTQRSDRTGVDRDDLGQGELVELIGDANVQQLIDTARKRLCYQCSAETRHRMEYLKAEIHNEDKFIANVLVPNCIYRCGCPEMNKCNMWHTYKQLMDGIDITDIQARYDAYNWYFYNVKIR